MNTIKTYEEFNKKIKELEIEEIRLKERYDISLKETEELLKELKTLSGKENIQEIIEFMKINKQELADIKQELDKEIEEFNKKLDEYGDLNV